MPAQDSAGSQSGMTNEFPGLTESLFVPEGLSSGDQVSLLYPCDLQSLMLLSSHEI